MIPILNTRINTDSDIFSSRRRARQIATMLDLDDTRATRFATAVSEIARNALQHAGGGGVEFVLHRLPGSAMLMARVIDRGPGIGDVDALLRDEAHEEHMGLRGSRRLVDHFSIEHRDGGGIAVTLKMELAPRYATMTQDELAAFVDDLIRRQPISLIEELEQQNREMMLTLEQLVEHQQQLREMDRRKDEFMAILAHELRNPLAAISNSLNMIGYLSPGNINYAAHEVITRQTRQLKRLVDDLMESSRFTLGKLQVERAPTRVADVVQHAVESSSNLFVERQQHFSTQLSDEDLWIDADAARMSQALGNLLHNASKFTPRDGHISLIVEAQADMVVLRVRDDGAGIDSATIPKLFELFGQGKTAPIQPAGGLGIGLSVVDNLVKLHGGKVEVKSAGMEQGSEFSILLPRIASPVAQQPVEQPAQAAGSFRILVVDDNVDGAQTMATCLDLMGHTTTTAYDGGTALQRFAEWGPEVVVLDIGLPDISGIDVAQAIRRDTGRPQPTLIAITGFSHEAARNAIRAAGFDHYLVKPAMPDQIIALLTTQPHQAAA